MDIKMMYILLKNIYLELGEENFFNIFDKSFPDYNLYDMSQDWVENKKYILKFKGIYGDLIIKWE